MLLKNKEGVNVIQGILLLVKTVVIFYVKNVIKTVSNVKGLCRLSVLNVNFMGRLENKACVNGANKDIITSRVANVKNVLNNVLGVIIMTSVLLVEGNTRSFLDPFVGVKKDTLFKRLLVFSVGFYVKFAIKSLVMFAVKMLDL